MKTLVLLALAAGALVIPSASAEAAPPGDADPTPFTLAAGEACSFPLEIAATGGKEGFIDLSRNPQYSAIAISPGLQVTVTNVDDPTKTVTFKAAGTFKYLASPDGSVDMVATGKNFFFGYPDAGATALVTTGPVLVDFDNDNGGIAALDLSGAQVRDLCQELA